MKPKTFYILMIICTMSLLSAARQAGTRCDKLKCCKAYEWKAAKKLSAQGLEKSGSDHSPFSLCLYSI